MMGFGMGFGLLLMLLFWGVLIVAAVWLAKAVFSRATRASGPGPVREASPREILDQRYARGEISREEHERIRQDLGA